MPRRRPSRSRVIAAEQAGVTSANADEKRCSADPGLPGLLGAQGDLGRALGVNDAWALNAIKQVANYAEIWDRNLAPPGLNGGANRLAAQGDLMWTLPLR